MDTERRGAPSAESCHENSLTALVPCDTFSDRVTGGRRLLYAVLHRATRSRQHHVWIFQPLEHEGLHSWKSSIGNLGTSLSGMVGWLHFHCK